MAVLSGNQVLRVWADGLSDKSGLFALRNVVTGDTADLGSDFTILKQAIIMGTTVVGTAVASVSGTVVTIPAGLSHDAGWLLVWGAAA